MSAVNPDLFTDDNLSNLETVAFKHALEVPVLTDEEFLS